MNENGRLDLNNINYIMIRKNTSYCFMEKTEINSSTPCYLKNSIENQKFSSICRQELSQKDDTQITSYGLKQNPKNIEIEQNFDFSKSSRIR